MGLHSTQQSAQVAGIALQNSQAIMVAGLGGAYARHLLIGGAAHGERNASTVDENGLPAAAAAGRQACSTAAARYRCCTRGPRPYSGRAHHRAESWMCHGC